MSQVFDAFDLSSFWEDSQYASESYVDATFTPEDIAAVERQLGYKLPASYIEPARTQNGRIPITTNHRTDEPASWASDHIASPILRDHPIFNPQTKPSPRVEVLYVLK